MYSSRLKFLTEKETEDFLKEEKRAKVYREYMVRILSEELRIQAESEESMSDNSEILKSIATRVALRKLINTLRVK